MEILYKGEIPKSAPYIGECAVCHTSVKAQKNELVMKHILEDMVHVVHPGVQCPICGAVIMCYEEGTRDAEPAARKLARMTEED